jgi:hypothetical protein
MAATQRKRWAAARKPKAAATPASAQAAGKKRRLTPEGRARIIAATKRRWAALGTVKAKVAGKSGAPEKATPAVAPRNGGCLEEGGAEAIGSGERASQGGCGTGDGGGGGCERAGR